MFTWASKFFLATTISGYFTAIIYGLSSGGSLVGTLSMGYKGGVGEHTGYAILMFVTFVSAVLMVIAIITRDGDLAEMSALAGSDRPIPLRPPLGPTVWSLMTAFGVAAMAIGLAISTVFLWLGLAVLAVVAIEWVILVWSERAADSPQVAAAIRDRLIGPFEIPMMAALGFGAVAIGISQILLTVSKIGSVVVAVVVAAFIFVSSVLIVKKRLSTQTTSAIVTFGILMVLLGGVLSAINGSRDFHAHGEHGEEVEHGEEHGEEGE